MKLGKYNFKIYRPCVMGICNLTPDSFSDGGTNYKKKRCFKQYKKNVGKWSTNY